MKVSCQFQNKMEIEMPHLWLKLQGWVAPTGAPPALRCAPGAGLLPAPRPGGQDRRQLQGDTKSGLTVSIFKVGLGSHYLLFSSTKGQPNLLKLCSEKFLQICPLED